MNEKQLKNIKMILKCMMVLAGLFAIIGAIVVLANVGKINSAMSAAMFGSSNAAYSSLTPSSFTVLDPASDIARFGIFAAFVVSCIFAAIEYFSGSPKKNFSFIIAGSSVLGFVGCFLTSVSPMNKLLTASFSSGLSSSMSIQLIKDALAPWIVGGIFILISAVAVIGLVGATFIKPKPAFGYAAGNPNMQYPNQQYPNQQFPNQQIPNQQYPNQPYAGQAPVNYQQPQNQNNNNPNNFQ